jgi:hypothetical protein
MTSMIKRVIPVTVGLLLLAGSPAFAARHDAHHDTRQEELMGASAQDVTAHHGYRLHHVFISPRAASSFDAVPGWAEPPRPSMRYDDVPSYNDPSKFGGGEALPVQ